MPAAPSVSQRGHQTSLCELSRCTCAVTTLGAVVQSTAGASPAGPARRDSFAGVGGSPTPHTGHFQMFGEPRVRCRRCHRFAGGAKNVAEQMPLRIESRGSAIATSTPNEFCRSNLSHAISFFANVNSAAHGRVIGARGAPSDEAVQRTRRYRLVQHPQRRPRQLIARPPSKMARRRRCRLNHEQGRSFVFHGGRFRHGLIVPATPSLCRPPIFRGQVLGPGSVCRRPNLFSK